MVLESNWMLYAVVVFNLCPDGRKSSFFIIALY